MPPAIWGIAPPQYRSCLAISVWAHVSHRVGRLLMPLPRRRMGLSSDEERALSEGAKAGKGGGIEGADARQSAARSTAPRRTHAQTTSSPSIMPLPAGEASRPPTASVYRIKQELDADGGSAVVGDAIAIGGLVLRPPRRRLARSACGTHASLLD